MLHGIMSEQEHCLYSSDSVSVRMKLFHTFSYKSIALVHKPKNLYSVNAIKSIDICYTCYE